MFERQFPSLKIDQFVDSTTCHQLLSFMDVYFDYNQIPMHEDDQEATTFITEEGTYYYKVMSLA